ncbi:hypothetical protein SKAU_G00212120 [Synaphobranchus kaupii]|uniref:LINE-1 type transposase domain-containing 1 n=1 Tax=Synaphobranchus kaupii TaxID=118154 RepID=A0A9Q1F997_SYNKA|nr:hypothetical protein SKAU_G00212120 [Synaphobranchus kaupii]
MEKDMSTSPAREGRKREVEQSPIKQKFKDSSLSREDLDDAITGGIRLALQEQQRTLDAAVTSAVKEAVNSILIPQLRSIKVDIEQTNEYVRGLRTDFEHQAKIAQKTQNRVDSIQLAVREDRQGIVELQKQVEQLTQKTADMEDRARRNNVRLVGLPESLEGSDAAGYLKANLAKWIPSLAGRGIEIDRAHFNSNLTPLRCGKLLRESREAPFDFVPPLPYGITSTFCLVTDRSCRRPGALVV